MSTRASRAEKPEPGLADEDSSQTSEPVPEPVRPFVYRKPAKARVNEWTPARRRTDPDNDDSY